jgi:glyoxylase-like metal-dependent hydrolase (beta-lactamase superfamily II)
MAVETFVVGPMKSNCYMFSDGDAVAVVDPGADAALVTEQIRARSATPNLSILLTHGHIDQIQCVPRLVKLFPEAAVYAGRADNLFLFDATVNLSRHVGAPLTFVDISGSVRNVATGASIAIGNHEITVIETPGHTPGSLLYHFATANIAFCGDTILKGTVGGSNLPFGDEGRLFASIRDRILTLPDDVKLLPAHGPATTVAAEKAGNPYVQAMSTD